MQDGQLERLARSDLADTEADRAVAAEGVLHEWRPAGYRISDGQMEDGRSRPESYSSDTEILARILTGALWFLRVRFWHVHLQLLFIVDVYQRGLARQFFVQSDHVAVSRAIGEILGT